ncbi:hypothetical protein B0T16DRAFT_503749 [Cercophora newfieldiana]|uniref:Phosphatidate phosphatase APP1 catalytic domain-containing protein n=1 Tax=Cercophora newfieldiana TaxID=92897 RepID=A0AA39YF75_9PEZI|nr:hypothetical protein B0T16DRAFT_503749 [Cercophora newfieldiana]
MRSLSILSLLFGVALAIPNPVPPHPMITQAPQLDSRDFLEDLDHKVHSIVNSLGSTVSGFIASGVPQFFQSLPIGEEAVVSMVSSVVGSVANIVDIITNDTKPTQVLNLPAYGNWTKAQKWNVFVHGNVYKLPGIPSVILEGMADMFLIAETKFKDLKTGQQQQAKNMTASILVIQEKNVTVTMEFNQAAGTQTLTLPGFTTVQGDFGEWVSLENITTSTGYLLPGNATNKIQTLEMHATGTDTGNATAYLVPPQGFTIISDIDDVLREARIWDFNQGVLNSFANTFGPWMNMPEIYAHWASAIPDAHFHYLTTTPEQVTRNYMEFVFAHYPPGSFDSRPLRYQDVDAVLSARKFLLDRIFETFPQRKFILVGDVSNTDIMKAYPQLAKEHPGSVQCILLRNTSSADASFKFPYDTSGFSGLETKQYMFFRTPDDLKGLNFANGECVNRAVPQNVTFGVQGVSGGVAVFRSGMWAMTAAVLATVLAMWY